MCGVLIYRVCRFCCTASYILQRVPPCYMEISGRMWNKSKLWPSDLNNESHLCSTRWSQDSLLLLQTFRKNCGQIQGILLKATLSTKKNTLTSKSSIKCVATFCPHNSRWRSSSPAGTLLSSQNQEPAKCSSAEQSGAAAGPDVPGAPGNNSSLPVRQQLPNPWKQRNRKVHFIWGLCLCKRIKAIWLFVYFLCHLQYKTGNVALALLWFSIRGYNIGTRHKCRNKNKGK